jgi:hypothetical protein
MRVGLTSQLHGGSYQLFNLVPAALPPTTRLLQQEPAPVITITKVPMTASTAVAGGALMGCNQCAYQTTRRDLLQRHAKTHEAAAQQCGQCDFSSSRLDVLSKHRKTAHEGLREASHRFTQRGGIVNFLNEFSRYFACRSNG